jgi:hypothetical protein
LQDREIQPSPADNEAATVFCNDPRRHFDVFVVLVPIGYIDSGNHVGRHLVVPPHAIIEQKTLNQALIVIY